MPSPLPGRVETRRTVAFWFFVCGFTWASFVPHIPRLTEELKVSDRELGLLLLCMPAGSLIGMVSAPRAIDRAGPSRSAWFAGLILALLLVGPIAAQTPLALAASLLPFGLAMGLMDVTMNTAAAETERQLGKPIMSSLHGWFSIGTVAGGGTAVALWTVSKTFPPWLHALLVTAVMLGLLFNSRPRGHAGSATVTKDQASSAPQSWLSARSLSLAALAFICMFLEGAISDWLGLLAMRFGATAETAPRAFSCFTITWASGRFLGDRLTRSLGDTAMLVAGGVLTSLGMAAALMTATPLGVMIGGAIVGLGIANAIPVLFRAAAAVDASGRGTALVVVTGTGYAGFLIGPPLMGFTSDAVGLPGAMLLVVAGGLVLALGAVALRTTRH